MALDETPETKHKPFTRATCHPDRWMKAKGLCSNCYETNRRAEIRAQEINAGEVQIDEETGLEVREDGTEQPVEMDLTSDPRAVFEFYKIMWSWLRGMQEAEVPIRIPGTQALDHKTMTRNREIALAKATRAASVLGRAYIAERRIEERPEELPVAGMGDMIAGWKQVQEMVKQVPRTKGGADEKGFNA